MWRLPISPPLVMQFLTLPMLRLLSSKAQGCKDFWKSPKPCHVGIHWKACIEYSQMSTHLPGFQSFSHFIGFSHYFVLAKFATISLRDNTYMHGATLEKIFSGSMTFLNKTWYKFTKKLMESYELSSNAHFSLKYFLIDVFVRGISPKLSGLSSVLQTWVS